MTTDAVRFHIEMAYALRVEAYALLVHDRFPVFSLSEEVDEAVLVRQAS